MNAHTAPSVKTQTIVLRVLEGRQAGAEYRLTQGISVTVGHGFRHDIVLRASSEKDISIQLDIKDAVIGLTMIGGQASILGRLLNAGESAQLPYYVPLAIGKVSFAIGDPDSERWSETAILGQGTETAFNPAETDTDIAAEAVPAEKADTGIAHQAQGALQLVRQSLTPVTTAVAIERRWPLYAMIAATMLIALLLFNPISNWVNREYFGLPAAQKMVHDAGFPDVKVQETVDGNLLFKGLVRNDAQLTRLRNLISEKQPHAVVDVATMDGLASNVTDMLVAQGIDAEAKPGRNKALIIDSEYLPGDRQEELALQIRKDMPALGRINFLVNPERGEPMLQYFFASTEYGIASFVDGDPAYISTGNGDKWFKGATVPTGHVIIDIGDGRVRFEREGRIEELSFAADDPASEDGLAASKNSENSQNVVSEERKTT
jgi:type III secretion protein D